MHANLPDAAAGGAPFAPPSRTLARRMLHGPAALALLLITLVWSLPSRAAPHSPPEGGHDLLAEWTGTDAASRVVAGPDGLIHVLGGVYVRHMRPDGTVEGSTRVENIKELAVGPTGDLFGAKVKEVMALRRGAGTVIWRKVLPANQHQVIGERPPYLSAIAWDASNGRLQVLYDQWDDVENATLVDEYDDRGDKRRGLTLGNKTHSYWDMEARGGELFVLDRSLNTLEVYRNGSLVDLVTLPAQAERFSVGPDGSIYFVHERQYVVRADRQGRPLEVWDATDVTPGLQSSISDVAVDDVGRVYVTDPRKASVRVYAPAPGHVNPEQPPVSPLFCETKPDKWASPSYLRLGEKTKVTLRLGGNCPSVSEKADIVLVVDRSNSMSDSGKIGQARLAVADFIDVVMPRNQPDQRVFQVGMVMFQNQPELLAPLSFDRNAVLNQIPKLEPAGGTNIADALELGMTEVLGPAHRPDAKPIIVLLTDGVPFNNTRMLTVDVADRVRDAGITVYAIGLGQDVDPNLLRLVARRPELYFFAPSASELAAVFTGIAKRISASVLLKTVTITDHLPKNMAYIEGSADPAAVWDTTARTLTWRFTPVPFSGVEMSFWVEPLEVGTHPTNTRADYEGTDGLDQPNSGVFPVPSVIVIAPPRTPTVTVPSPPPTITVIPPSPTVTPTPTDPPPPTKPRPIFIPIVFNDKCIERHTDVVLILDDSTTMRGRMADGRIKLDGAKDAARAFIDQLALEKDNLGYHDQAAVIWYNETARTEQGLTQDRAALLAAIDRIPPPSQGSRIDLGLQYAHQQLILGAETQLGNTPAVVLLSDGEPNHTTLEAVYAAADAIKRTRALVFTVGFKDVYFREEVLRHIASSADRYYYAPRAEDLAGIYRQIAGRLICH